MLLKSFDASKCFEDLVEELRDYVLARDEGKCLKCGDSASEPHHVIYRSHQGKHCANNLATLCNNCHFMVHNTKDDIKKLLIQAIIRNEKKLRKRLI